MSHNKQTAKLISRICESLPPEVVTTRSSVVRVDRSVRPVYPKWARGPVYPQLETVGPAEYDLSRGVELWLHKDQKDGKQMRGVEIHEYLRRTDSLRNCLSLHDAAAIQQMGLTRFTELFGDKTVYFWKSVVYGPDNVIRTPCVMRSNSELVIVWGWLVDRLTESDPGLRFVN